MAAPRPSRPFTRRGITFTSQYAYRQFLAAERGLASVPQMRKRQAEAREEIRRLGLGELTQPQAGRLAADIAEWKHRIGSYVEGQAPAERGSSRLPPEMLARLRAMGAGQYPIWRLLYTR